MNKKKAMRPLDAAMNDSYSTAELYAAFENEVFSKPRRMDVALLREIVYSLLDQPETEAAPHKETVWEKITDRIQASRRPFALGLSRKKLIILAIALILLLTGAALAMINWNAVIESVYHMEKQENRVEKWSLEQKKQIADALKNTDYDMSGLPDLSMLNGDEKDAVLTKWLKEQFDGEVNSCHYNLMTKLNGFFDGWSLTDKAWYSQMLAEHGEVYVGEFVSVYPPGHEPENLEKLEDYADRLIREAYDDTAIDPDTLTPYLFYGYIWPDKNTRYWRICYRDEYLTNRMTVQIEDASLSTDEPETCVTVVQFIPAPEDVG